RHQNKIELDGKAAMLYGLTMLENNVEAGLYSDVIRIIAEESQIPQQELNEGISLLEVGVNHMLWQEVGDRVREELDVDLEQNNLKAALSQLKAPSLTGSPSTLSPISFDSPIDTPSTSTWERTEPTPSKVVPPATSLILQGSLLNSRKLFLFPDASGSATSYVHLPQIAPDLVVFGLHSPYVRNSSSMTCTFDDLVISFWAEVRRRQPEGPYDFAGWSAGGSLAFRCAQILLSQGETINSLTLIDAPMPSGLGGIPESFHNCLENNGIFRDANGSTAAWIVPHFRAMMKLLPTMRITRAPFAGVLNVRILWAGRSFLQRKDLPFGYEEQAGEPEAVQFLTVERKDFGPCGWAFLLPGSKIWTGKVEADHFEMMKPPYAEKVSKCIAEALKGSSA
ncbi:Non-reducing polyketide synthase VdtA, partial [Pseudocercospora fuligena]